MAEEKDIERTIYLKAKRDTRSYQTSTGGRVEVSSEVTHDPADPKANARSTAQGRSEDAASRKAVALGGRDSTHAHPAERGFDPKDKNNLAPMGHVANRGAIKAFDKETRNMLADGHKVQEKRGFIYRTGPDGQREQEPLGMRADRKNLTTGKEECPIYFGNFSDNKKRLFDSMPAGEKPTKDQTKQAEREDWNGYKENRARHEQQMKEAGGRRYTKAEMRERLSLVKNDTPEKKPDSRTKN